MTAGDASAGRSTLRTALRTSFRGALERLAAAGTMPLLRSTAPASA